MLKLQMSKNDCMLFQSSTYNKSENSTMLGNFYSPVLHLVEIYRVARCYEMCQKSFHFHCQICQCNELTDGLRAELYFQWHRVLRNGMFIKQINVLN